MAFFDMIAGSALNMPPSAAEAFVIAEGSGISGVISDDNGSSAFVSISGHPYMVRY